MIPGYEFLFSTGKKTVMLVQNELGTKHLKNKQQF